jgi:hypothetical protein
MFLKKVLFSGQNPAKPYPVSFSGVQFYFSFLDKLDSKLASLCFI